MTRRVCAIMGLRTKVFYRLDCFLMVLMTPPEKHLQVRERSLERLHALTTGLLDIEDIGIFLQRIAESVQELFGFGRVSISIIDLERGVFTDHALAGYSSEEEAMVRISEKAFLKEDVLKDFRADCRMSKIAYYIPVEKQSSSPDEFVGVRDKNSALKPRSSPDAWHELDLLYFALNDRTGDLIGYLQADYPVDNKVPSLDTIGEIELFAGIAAVGLENHRVFRRAHDLLRENEEKTENTLRLLELTRSVLRVDDIDVVLNKVVSAMVSAFNYRKGGISLFTEGSNDVTIHALSGYSKGDEEVLRKQPLRKDKILEDFREEFRVTSTGYFIPGETQTSHPEDFVFIESPDMVAEKRKASDAWHELDLLYFGLYDRAGRMIGYLQLDYPLDGKIPTKETMDSMEAYASIASVAIENSVMFKEMSSAKSEVKMYLDLLTHDVGNYVNPISAYVELVLGTTQVTPTQSKYLSSALEGTKSISHLIRNVRRSAQMLESTESELVPRDLVKTLEAVTSEVKNAFLSRKVEIRTKLPDGDVWVMTDGLMDEVFYNLMSNSVKYDDHDEVVIDVIVDYVDMGGKKYARVRVVDRGVGIPDDLKPKVFSKGFRDAHRMERPILQKAKGAGMGLSLVKSLIDRYGGKIWVENRVYADHSMGSVFNVILPLP